LVAPGELLICAKLAGAARIDSAVAAVAIIKPVFSFIICLLSSRVEHSLHGAKTPGTERVERSVLACVPFRFWKQRTRKLNWFRPKFLKPSSGHARF
jgi:hypothetical protein